MFFKIKQNNNNKQNLLRAMTLLKKILNKLKIN